MAWAPDPFTRMGGADQEGVIVSDVPGSVANWNSSSPPEMGCGMIPVVMKCFLSLLAGCFLLPSFASADAAPQPEESGTPREALAVPDGGNIFGRAVQVERLVTSTTGLAISPLLGMGVLGVLEWWRASAEERADLPWYAHPWVWGVALGLFLLNLSKDTVGVVIPEAIKKPLTVVEVLENKLCGVIVALAVIPASVAAHLPDGVGPDQAQAWGGGGPVLAVFPVVGLPVLVTLLLIAVFAVVFLVSHACKCFLLLSPSSWVTAGLKAVKGLFLSLFVATAVLAPWAGVALSLLIVLVCLFISGWAFRWNVFGALFLRDFLGSRFDREVGEDEPLRGFSAAALPGVPPRTYGDIRRDGEDWVFRYRPWLVFPWREERWRGTRSGLRVGLLAPALTMERGSRRGFVTVFDFRLRFRNNGDVLERRLRVDERQPSRVIQGMRQAFLWVREQLSWGGTATLERLEGKAA